MQDVEVEPTDLTSDVQNSAMQSHDDCSDGSVNNEDILQSTGSAEATIEILPQEFLKGMDPAIYQDDFAHVHQSRGRDKPSFPAKNVRGMAAIVIVHSENTAEAFGSLRGTTPAPFVKLAFHMESQWGGLSLRIKRSSGQMVVWKAFPSSLKRDLTHRCKPAFEINLGRNAKHVPVGQEQLENARAQDVLFETHFELVDGDADAASQAPAFDEPAWRGIAPHQLQQIQDDYLRGKDMNSPDALIACLMACARFTVYHTWKPTDDCLSRFAAYLTELFWVTALVGPCWYYILASPGMDIYAPDYDFDVEPPRWLVTKWKPTQNEEGTTYFQPLLWEQFGMTGIWPNTKVAAFAYRLGAVRAKAARSKAARASLVHFASNVRAEIAEIPNRSDVFHAILTPSKISARVRLRLPITTSLNIVIWKKKYCGTVNEIISGPQPQIVVTINGQPTQKMLMNEPLVSVRLEDGPKTARIKQGLCSIGRDTSSEYGCDMGSIWFGRSIEGRGPIRNLLGKATMDTFNRILTLFSLNNKQVDFARESVNSASCATWADGPPGTGKSYTQMATLLALKAATATEKQQRWAFLCVAHSNEGVDANMEKFCLLADSKQVGHEFEVIRFIAASRQLVARPCANTFDNEKCAENTQTVLQEIGATRGDQDVESFTTAGVDLHQDRSYQARLRYYIEKWASDPHAVQHKHAEAYMTLLEQASGEISRDEAKSNSELRQTFEKELSKYFLANVVDGVFTTYVSSGHSTLMAGFQPKILAMDQLSLVTMAEAAIPAGHYHDSVMLMLGAGDTKEDVIEENNMRNECHSTSTRSLLRHLSSESTDRRPVIHFNVQYRSSPEIYDCLKRVMHDNKVKNHFTTKVASKVGITASHCFNKRFGAAYRGKTIVAIDASGGRSVPTDHTSTHCNETEACMVTDLIELMLQYPAPPRGRQLQLNDFAVITAHNGQERLIKKLLTERDMYDPMLPNGVSVFSAGVVHGREFEIVILSLCSNVEGSPTKLLPASNSMLVQLSRAKSFFVVMGNFQGWIRKMHGEDDPAGKLGNTQRYFAQFVRTFYQSRIRPNIISEADFARGLADETITQAEFPGIIRQMKEQ